MATDCSTLHFEPLPQGIPAVTETDKNKLMEVAKPLLPVVLALIAGYFGMRQSVAGLDMKVEHTNDRLEDLKVQIERGTASRWTLDQHNSYANIVSERFAAMKDAMGRDSGDIAMLRQSVAVLDAEIDRLRMAQPQDERQ